MRASTHLAAAASVQCARRPCRLRALARACRASRLLICLVLELVIGFEAVRMHRSVAGLDMGRQVDGDGRRLVALLAAVFERQAYGVGVRHAAVARTAGPALAPTQARPHMDDVRNAWNNAPACVLGTVWGTASIRTWRFRSAPCLPIRQVITVPLCARYTPSCRRARARLWVCG